MVPLRYMNYTTSTLLTNKLGRPLTADELAYFTGVLSPAIDAYINTKTGTSFGNTAISTIYVDGDDTKTLVIPTMHDITEIKADEVVLTATTDYTLYPKGSVDTLAIKSTGTWNTGDENIAVKGQLGYKVIPAGIQLVATELAVASMTETVNGLKSESVGDWSVSYDNAVKGISPQSLGILEGYARLSRRM